MDASEAPAPSVDPSPHLVALTPLQKMWLISLKGREEACGKVAHFLIGLGVCPRCVFRLLKMKEVKFYREDVAVRWRCVPFGAVQLCKAPAKFF